MNKPNTLADQYLSQLKVEHDAFIEGMSNQPASEIIKRAYEIVCKQEIIYKLEVALECYEDDEIQAVIDDGYTLHSIYNEWLRCYSEDFTDINTVVFQEIVNQAIG